MWLVVVSLVTVVGIWVVLAGWFVVWLFGWENKRLRDEVGRLSILVVPPPPPDIYT